MLSPLVLAANSNHTKRKGRQNTKLLWTLITLVAVPSTILSVILITPAPMGAWKKCIHALDRKGRKLQLAGNL